MISIKNKKDCNGCSACVQACPKQCISLKNDKEGFLYPSVNLRQCIHCNICEKICPQKKTHSSQTPLYIYAAHHKDENIRNNSSSGGIFTYLATQIIEKKGVVFGAKFDTNWKVKHDYTETMKGIEEFRGSKYLQSQIGDSYKQAEEFLKSGRLVMFTGTPCQIMGLKSFLKKDYPNLLTIDFVCHGVPSPKIWDIFIKQISKKDITYITFRDKKLGWKEFSTVIKNKNVEIYRNPHNSCSYMKAFLSDYSLRPSCYHCIARQGKSGSDITIGDFWGIDKINKEYDYKKGCSLFINNSPKAAFFQNKNDIFIQKHQYSDIIKHNPSVERNPSIPYNRDYFFFLIRISHNFQWSLEKVNSYKLKDRIIRFIYKEMLKNII